MKSSNAGPDKGSGRRTTPMRIPQIPMEWMDPMSWRLPSGKALAEFALQAGFLAPLMMGSTGYKKRKKTVAPVERPESVKAGLEAHGRETPEQSGNFRETR